MRLAGVEAVWKGNAQEDHGKAPDLKIRCRFQELLEREGFHIAIISVLVNATDNECAFSLI